MRAFEDDAAMTRVVGVVAMKDVSMLDDAFDAAAVRELADAAAHAAVVVDGLGKPDDEPVPFGVAALMETVLESSLDAFGQWDYIAAMPWGLQWRVM